MAEILPEFCRKPVLVLGCGNILFGDDGFGPAVVERLEREMPDAMRERVCLMDAGTGARTVLFTLTLSEARPRHLLVVDAVDAGKEPGEVFVLSPDALPVRKLDDFSMHQLPTSNLLRELRDACGVDVEIVSCQVAEVPDRVAPGLSETVRNAIPVACQAVMDRIGRNESASDGRPGRREGDPQRSCAAR